MATGYQEKIVLHIYQYNCVQVLNLHIHQLLTYTVRLGAVLAMIIW